MPDLHPLRSRSALAVTLFAAMAACAPCRGQEGERGDPQAAPAKPQEADESEEWVPQMMEVTLSTMEARLALEIERLERSLRITPEQRRKLEVAGRGDLKRLGDRVRDAAERLLAAKGDKARQAAILEEIETLRRQSLAALPQDGPMFTKTLAKVLRADQIAAYLEARRESRRFRHRARVDSLVAMLDTKLGLAEEQRQHLTTLLLEETRLPSGAPEEPLVLLAQAARLPEAKLRAILDDAQWGSLSILLKNLAPEMKAGLDRAVFDPEDTPGPVAGRPEAPASSRE